MTASAAPEQPIDWSVRTGHVVVCGLHEDGLSVVEQLRAADVEVVVVDDRPDPRLVRTLQQWQVPLLEQDSRYPHVLRAAGAPGATAVVCVESDDLHTLETALAARELNPQARIVVQLRNPAVGRAVQGIGVAVLDVAGLSAPALVEACLKSGAHPVQVASESFVVASTVVRRRATLRHEYEDLAPVAVQPRITGAGAEVAPVICPGRDHVVHPGDRVTMIGPVEQMRRAGFRVQQWEVAAATLDSVPVGARFAGAGERSPRRGGSAQESLKRLVRWLFVSGDRRIRTVLVALLTLVVGTTVLLEWAYQEPAGDGMTHLDALYFTIETVATVGYGDFNFREQPTWLRLYAVFLMIFGAVLTTALFALLTNLLITRRIEESLGRLRVTRLSGHVVVVGLGSIGVRVVQLLVQRGLRVVVVEADPDNRYLPQARALGVPVVSGDATQPQTLQSVHVTRARAVAVLTSDDLTNIETGLAVADQLQEHRDQVPVVLRLFDRHRARTVASGFGFDAVRSTAALAAPWFVGAALGLQVRGTFYVADVPMLLAGLRVPAGGGLDGLALRDLSARIRVVAIQRADGRLEHPPRRDTRLAAGDEAHLIGPHEELLRVLRT